MLKLDWWWSCEPHDPLVWSDEDEEDDEQLELDRQRQEFFEGVLTEAGRKVSGTVGELADLIIDQECS
ncbi:hypothetical protein [Nocardia sp. NRRL S-836]|uniref:hypothetical protein n=1 Tax=Nocardia sp. NRRL S-836 TaxID=1519492 RepID=UPI0006B02BB5|nr:hypothetical protein [Nocardia sp. NRRL S-836]KOV82121.1 hypothetical protein ADL03_25685 [Nocardia sp. NRRL S-836]